MKNSERQKKYREDMHKKGFVQKCLWVPEALAEALSILAGLKVPMGSYCPQTGDEIDAEFCHGCALEMAHHMRLSFEEINVGAEQVGRMQAETIAHFLLEMSASQPALMKGA